MKLTHAILSSVLLTLLSTTGAFAAAPSNDNFTNAFTLSGYRSAVSQPTAEATKEPSEPAHAGNRGGSSVWFRWTAPVRGQLTLDTTGTDFDTLLAVYTGDSLPTLVPVAANDDNPSTEPQSLVRFTVTAGQTYRIAVDGYDGVRGRAVLSWSLQPTPVNDDFASALVIAGRCGTVRNFSLAGTREANEPEHAGNVGGASIWFRWIAPTNGPVRFSTLGSLFDTVLASYTGSGLESLTLVRENDDLQSDATSASQVDFDAIAGTTYHIAIDGYNGASGAWRLNWQIGRPDNDDFAAALVLVGSSGSRTDCNLLATPEPGEPAHAGNPAGQSLWYAWTAPTNGTYVFNSYGSRADTKLGVYTGTEVTNLTLIGQNNQADDNASASRVVFNATNGVTYRIAVDGLSFIGYVDQGLLALHWSGTPAPNDQRTNATPITDLTGVIDGANFFASLEIGESNILAQPVGRSIWYSWTPARSGVATFTTEESAIDTLLGVYRASGANGLSVVAESDDIDGNADILQSRVSFAAMAGTNYWIAINGYAGEEGGIRLAWDTTPPPLLSVSRDATNVIVNWTGTVYQLEATDELPEVGQPSWVRVPGAPPRRLSGDGRQRFFRAVWP